MSINTPEELKAAGEALAIAKDYADLVLQSPLKQLGGILSDTVGYWRLKNQIRLILKAKEFLKAKGVEPRKILPDIFVPILDEGGNVEDETLADMFAALLTCHLDPTNQNAIHPSFSKVLIQLSPTDAKLLAEARKHVSDKQYRDLGLRGSAMTVDRASEFLDATKDEAYLSCVNLRRLGLFRHLGAAAPQGHPFPQIFEDDRDHQDFRITEYGISFCDACGVGDGFDRPQEKH